MKKTTHNNKILTLDELAAKTKPVFANFGVEKAELFGSYARREATKESDIDILVKFKEGKSLLDLVGLRQALMRKLGKSVDVATKGSLHPLIKKNVYADLMYLYGK